MYILVNNQLFNMLEMTCFYKIQCLEITRNDHSISVRASQRRWISWYVSNYKKNKNTKIKGIIDRQILINYQVNKEILENYLPKPFRPKLVKGKGIVGICLIKLKEIRPKGLPRQIGISSENGAHMIAVEWSDNGKLKEGVYIPKRDTSSKLNSLAGGTIFPGIHHLAEFTVDEFGGNYYVAFISEDETPLQNKDSKL